MPFWGKNMQRENDKNIRKYNVLGHIVYLYVSTSVPISSKVVADFMGNSLSSATVRNIMADLEVEGYLTHLHTSAGRIPTNSGYRCYVDMLQDKINLEKRETKRIEEEYSRKINTIREVIEITSSIISREVQNASLVTLPSIEDFYLKRLDLIKTTSKNVLAILITMTNSVHNYILDLGREVETEQLNKIANYINDEYQEEHIHDIPEKIKNELSQKNSSNVAGEDYFIARDALAVLVGLISSGLENDICWEGLNYFFDNTRNSNVASKIVQMFSNKGKLQGIMRRDLRHEGVKIYIGDENNDEDLNECSFITYGYSLRGRTVGRLGVIGPTRMNYNRTLGTLKCLSEVINEKLKEING